MADLRELAQKEGWYFSDEGLKQLTDDGKISNLRVIIKKALDVDLRDVADPGFPEEVGRCKVEGIPGGLVVQLQKVRNVSAPKANEESGAAPRMLKLTLTDGHSTCHALEIERIPSLTINTPPGTKILLKSKSGEENIPVCSNFLLLNSDRAEVLGGRVAPMIEKWELNRSLAKHKRMGGEDGGPPPWIPFGQKIIRSNPADKNFKSLQEKEKQSCEAPNPEFEAQRQDAIAEAGKAVAKKVFGGGNKPLLDHNVQQVVDLGFTIEQAENALKITRNNVDRAIKSLQRQADGPKSHEGRKFDKDNSEVRPRENPREGGVKGKSGIREGGKGRHDDEGGVSAPAKPSGRVSLFDFLEDKLPLEEKEKYQASARMNQDRGGRGGGRGGNGRGSYMNDREPRGGNYERGGKAGRGRGDRRPERNPRDQRDDPRSREENRFKDRRDGPRSREFLDSKPKKDGSLNGKSSTKPKDKGDQKAPRFQNPKTSLQHESLRYVGHTPTNAVSTNSSLGQGVPDWGAPLSRKVDMMSLIDCENTPDDETSFGNPSWSSRHPDNSLSKQHSQPRFHHNESARNHEMQSPKGSMGAPGGPRNAFNNTPMPKIPDFPFKDNMHLGNPLLNGQGGYLGNNGNNYNNPGNPRNMGNSRNPGSSGAMPGGRIDSSLNSTIGDCDGPGAYWTWNTGDKCLAKYWEDEKYYDAIVTGVKPGVNTIVVRFLEYGNHEEVLKEETIPVTNKSFSASLKNALNSGCPASSLPLDQAFFPMVTPGTLAPKSVKSMNSMNSHTSNESNGIPFSGSVEFRRGGTRPFVKPLPAAGAPCVVAVGAVGAPEGPSRRPARAPQSMYVPPAQRK